MAVNRRPQVWFLPLATLASDKRVRFAGLAAPSAPAAANALSEGSNALPYRNTNRKFCDSHHMR